MPKVFQLILALLGPCLDLVGALLLSVYVVAGAEKMENIIQSLKGFSYELAARASALVFRDPKGLDYLLEAPISKTPGVAAAYWFISPFVVTALIIAPLFHPLVAAMSYSSFLFLIAIIFSPKVLQTRMRLAIYALSIILLFTALFYFIPLDILGAVLFVPVVVLLALNFTLTLPIGFVFLVRWTVEKEKEKRVSVLGLILLLSGFIVQGVYNVITIY